MGSPLLVPRIIDYGRAEANAIPTLERLTEHADPQIAERAKAALRQVRGRWAPSCPCEVL